MAQIDRDGISTSPEAPPSTLTWRGVWTTEEDYYGYDAFYYDGSSYIVITAHTSGTFATDLASGLFELMAAKGTAGSGTGDLLAANNLSEVNPVTARANLGAAALNAVRGTITMHATTMNIWGATTILDGTGSAVDITAIANAPSAGATRKLYPPAGTTITHGATFDVEGNDDYQTVAGDALVFEAITTSTYKVVIHKDDGTAVVSSNSDIKSFTAVANIPANGVTITLPPGSLQFRSTDLTSGEVVTRTNTASSSLVISSGSTLGAVDNKPSRIAVLAVDNGSGFSVAAVNAYDSDLNLDETGLITTEAEGGAGGADGAWTIYSTSVLTNRPYRVIGFYDETQTTAGTHSAALTQVHGVSGRTKMDVADTIHVTTDIGFGSTNTAIRRFSTIEHSQGNSVSFNDSATLGSSFTINKTGIYAISLTDNFTAAAHMGISKNSNQLTTGIQSITQSHVLAATTTTAAAYMGNVAITTLLYAGDVIRAHAAPSGGNSTSSGERFCITRIA